MIQPLFNSYDRIVFSLYNLHFEQYAFVDGAMQLFSTGNYELSDGADFEFGPDDKKSRPDHDHPHEKISGREGTQ